MKVKCDECQKEITYSRVSIGGGGYKGYYRQKRAVLYKVAQREIRDGLVVRCGACVESERLRHPDNSW